MVVDEVDNGTAQAQNAGKDELGVDDLVERIFSLDTPVVPSVAQDLAVASLSSKVDRLTKVLASLVENQSSSHVIRAASSKDGRKGQPPSPPKSSSSSSSSHKR